MNDRITIREFLKNYKDGHYKTDDVYVQRQAGWHDWFCNDTSLRNKTTRLARCLKSIVDTDRFNIDKTCVFFRNNEPLNGKRYDSISVCDIKTDEVLFCIIPTNTNSGDEKRQSEVWGKENNFECPLVSGTWDDVKAFFLGTANS